jgi:hypothetical protein
VDDGDRESADVIWATNSPEFFLLMVRNRGWEPERFGVARRDLEETAVRLKRKLYPDGVGEYPGGFAATRTV